MSTSIAHRYLLDENKRRTIVALVANGSSRRTAARFVGCSASTITRTAVRDPQFDDELTRAEQIAEIGLLRKVQAAAKDQRHWRAAAWLLERKNPEDFAARPTNILTEEQLMACIAQLIEILCDDLPEENYLRAVKKVETLVLQIAQASHLDRATNHPKEALELWDDEEDATLNDTNTCASDATS